MTAPEKMGLRDSVTFELRKGDTSGKNWSRDPKERIGIRGTVTARLYGPDGTLKQETVGSNLVTDYGDDFTATRMFDDAINIITGMKLGTGGTAVAKNGAGATLVTYISGSQEALDATATDATKGAGLGWRTTYVCTWIATDVTNGAIAEVVLTNQTALADDTGSAGVTVARHVFPATIDKQVDDQLIVTWQLDTLGA